MRCCKEIMDDIPNILMRIARDRMQRVQRHGASQGVHIPAARTLPLVNFHRPADSGILIAEIKRKSPSKGSIADIPEPAILAGQYRSAGFRRVSVLTEESYFGGSLEDLIEVKEAHPDLAVLRKDFLLNQKDIEISWQAGADAILLIAALLEEDALHRMYEYAESLGLTCLVEVHTQDDVRKIRALHPPLVGINSRNLRLFRVDPLLPLATRTFIDWPCDIIYESGISSPSDVLFIRGTGFGGFLAGESVARDPALASNLIQAWLQIGEAKRCCGVWSRLYARYTPNRPLVKICGLTRKDDAQAAMDAGADLLGFVLAKSPRRVSTDFIRTCANLPVLKVGVVVLGQEESLPSDVVQLLEEGILDFIQFHGDETPAMVKAWPSYKALNLQSPEDALQIKHLGSPAVLIDAFSPGVRGGSGRLLNPETVRAAADQKPLWLAGGLTPENVAGIIREFHPELVDVSTGVAASDEDKAWKDEKKIYRFMEAVRGAGYE